MENDILLSHALDLARRCREEYVITNTPFCDMAQRSYLSSALRGCGVKFDFFGGYDGAERTVCVFLPDYIDEMAAFFAENPDDCPIEILRCTYKKGSPIPSHRDHLGSITALGLKREKTGDILLYGGGADIVVLKEAEKFLLSEYHGAGKATFDVAPFPISDITLPEIKTETVRGSVASARLDNLISEAFSLSRTSAAEAIAAGIVFVNDMKALKADAKVAEGSKLVLRGRGKVVFSKITGETRRGRLGIELIKYL